MVPLIEVENIGYRYNHQWVIKGVTFTLGQGELVGLIGPNGSGKTTLLKCLNGILYPQEGRVWWEGRSLSGFSHRQIARKMALVSQETSLFFCPTVLETVLMGRNPYLKRFQFEGPKDLHLAEEAMDLADVRYLKERLLSELSSGERQRVYLARALCQEPRVMLLDEPTAFLDIQHQVGILDLIFRLHQEKGLTILIASHDINLMAQYCQKIILIRQGKIEVSGPPDQVISEKWIEKVFETRVMVDQNPLTRTPRITLLGEREKSV
ncbi:MAG: ABC transporter ATP-binding protein [Thermodesulfobacteriota bacterium]